MGTDLILLATGLSAGFVDSIAGGGGLITLPVLTLFLGAGVQAIGTNKIAGTLAAVLALAVYLNANRKISTTTWVFVFVACVGSWIGSRIAPLLPPQSFKFLMILSLPLVLFCVWRKELWIQSSAAQKMTKHSWLALVLGGLMCGIYDGAWGPGGGTFMLLTLLFLARLPLFESIIASKLANTITAATALSSFAWQGVVHWRMGAAMGLGAALGAFLGAQFATRNASQMIRPVLALVALLLILKVAINT